MTVGQLIKMLEKIVEKTPEAIHIPVFQDSGNSIWDCYVDDFGQIVLTNGDN